MSKNLKESVDMVWHPYAQMQNYKEKPLLIVEGEGIYVKDDTGKEYIDGISSLWNVCLGHTNKEVIDGITKQMNKLQYFTLYGHSNEPSIELSLLISEMMENRFNHFFYTTSGSEAIDTAIKIIRHYFRNKGEGKRTKIISLENSFHGVTYGAMSAGGLSAERYEPYGPILEGFIKIPLCTKKLEEVITREGPDTIAAFLAEPILGAGGVIVPPDDFFTNVKSICDKYGIKLIMDEVSTGFGRLGTPLGVDHWNVLPDIFCGAKGISSGYIPLGVVGVSDEIFAAFLDETGDKWIKLNHGFTASGHPVSCSAGIATLKFLKKENLLEKVKQKGEFFGKQLEQLKESSVVADVRGKGLMWGIELIDEIAPLAFEIARKKGLISFITGSNRVLALFPPFITTEEELIRIREILQKVLELVEESMRMMQD